MLDSGVNGCLRIAPGRKHRNRRQNSFGENCLTLAQTPPSRLRVNALRKEFKYSLISAGAIGSEPASSNEETSNDEDRDERATLGRVFGSGRRDGCDEFGTWRRSGG